LSQGFALVLIQRGNVGRFVKAKHFLLKTKMAHRKFKIMEKYMKFNTMGLCPELLSAIEKLGFETPTDVQRKVIPFLLENSKNLVALAQTGTGKTGAFGLPILEQIDQSCLKTQALILCPTRELCMQIARDLKSFSCKMPKVRVLAVYGGTEIGPQLTELKHGVQIVVATPGRMVDLLQRRKANFSKIQRVVLDEADEMLNMGFEEDLKAILSDVPKDAQTLLFSATMPREVARIAHNYMNDPHEITVGSRNKAADLVNHEVMVVHAKDRYNALRRLVDVNPAIYGIIFCRTRVETQMVADRLSKDCYAAEALHGDMAQPERDHVMKKFRNHQLQLLVATDVAARGLDISDLTHVIHYAIPDDFNTYTHRSGRTGRAGKSGTSIAIIHLREHYKIERIEKKLGKPFKQIPIPTGKEITSLRLRDLAERARDYQSGHELVDDHLEEMCLILSGLSKEELIKRFALMEQHQMLQYYHNSPDLSTEPEKTRSKPKETNFKSGKEAREHHVPRQMTPGMIELVINIGKRNELTPAKLNELLGNSLPRGSVETGRINIVEMQTYFEVPYPEFTDVINHFKKHPTDFDGRLLNVALAGNAKPAESRSKNLKRKKSFNNRKQTNNRSFSRKKRN
jgi:ATP-dependent RNA helicase DeaD